MMELGLSPWKPNTSPIQNKIWILSSISLRKLLINSTKFTSRRILRVSWLSKNISLTEVIAYHQDTSSSERKARDGTTQSTSRTPVLCDGFTSACKNLKEM